MDKQLLDIDPFTGIKTFHSYDADTDTTIIEEVQDVAPYLEEAKRLRNDESYTRAGIKAEMWHYAILPNSIINILHRRGIDVFNKAQMKEAVKIINTEYPWLKTTRGTHA